MKRIVIDATSVDVIPSIDVAEIASVGVQGPPGERGGAYVHTQSTAANQWVVSHNLGFYPSVSVVSSGGVRIDDPEVRHTSTNLLTIYFVSPFTGTARLN